MHVTQFMGQVQINFNNTLNKAVENFHNTKNKAVENYNNTRNKAIEVKDYSKAWFSNKRAEWRNKWDVEIYPDNVKPLLDLYIRPLNTPLDKTYIVAAVVLAVASAIFIPLIIGKAAIPIAVALSTGIVGCAYTLASTRLNWHFNREALANHIEPALETLRNTTIATSRASAETISAVFTELSKPEYSHLRDDVKSIEHQFESYRNETFKINGGLDFENSKEIFFNQFERFKYKVTPRF
jgi:hypothetical protein